MQFLRDHSSCKVFAHVQPEDLQGMLNISGADINEIVLLHLLCLFSGQQISENCQIRNILSN